MASLAYPTAAYVYCHVGRQPIPCACFDALEHALGFTFRKSRELVKCKSLAWRDCGQKFKEVTCNM